MVQTSSLTKILILAGPTASGKTALSLKVAKALDCEIIGCDSMQIYKGLDIGTGKISPAEKQSIPHFMLDIIPPNGEFSVSEYVKLCDEVIGEIVARGKTPLLVGGTGLYLSGVLNGLDFEGATKSEKIREKYKKILAEQGKDFLFEILKSVDPKESERINSNDTKRIIRALEIFEQTGEPKSKYIGDKPPRYDYKFIVLSPPRDILYKNISKRVDKMIELGLINEVKSLYSFKDCQAMQAIGYKEIISYLDGNTTLEEAVELIKINTRHYAKRQLTYFRHMKANTEICENYSTVNDEHIIDEYAKFIKG